MSQYWMRDFYGCLPSILYRWAFVAGKLPRVICCAVRDIADADASMGRALAGLLGARTEVGSAVP